jgi:hypothetical protein
MCDKCDKVFSLRKKQNISAGRGMRLAACEDKSPHIRKSPLIGSSAD